MTKLPHLNESMLNPSLLNNHNFSEIQENIKNHQQIIQEGKKYRRELFGLMRQAENIGFLERFEEVKVLMKDYDDFLKIIEQYQVNYQKFTEGLITNLQKELREEGNILREKETKRQAMEQKFQTDNLVNDLKNKAKKQILKFIFRLGLTSFSLLQKLEVLGHGLSKLAEIIEAKKTILQQIKQKINEYEEFYHFQKELNHTEAQIIDKLKNTVNFEQDLNPLIASLQSLTNQLINLDEKLALIIQEITKLKQDFALIESENFLYIKAEVIDLRLIQLLITNQNYQQKLLSALKQSPQQQLNFDELNLIQEFPDLTTPLQQWQDYINNYLQQKLKNLSIKEQRENQNHNHNQKLMVKLDQENSNTSVNNLEKITEINYTNLEKLLKQNQWKEADYETYKLMIQSLNKKEGDHIYQDDFKNFPCADFQIIDQLWMQYSQGRFGFTIQAEIWLNCGGKSAIYDDQIAQKFGERVGWKRRNSWLNYNDLIFDLNAPSGHLPLIRVQYGGKNILFSRKIIPLIVEKFSQCEG